MESTPRCSSNDSPLEKIKCTLIVDRAVHAEEENTRPLADNRSPSGGRFRPYPRPCPDLLHGPGAVSRAALQLKASGSDYSPERALKIARRIQSHQVRIAGQGAASGLTDLSPEQLALFDQLQLNTATREPFDIAQVQRTRWAIDSHFLSTV